MRTPVESAAIIALVVLLCAACGPSGKQTTVMKPTTTPERSETSTVALAGELRGGGYVLFLRHAATDLEETDRDKSDLSDCSRQRNLTAEGREQAREIGAAFREAEIPVREALASPYCRTRQTAELIFGGSRVRTSSDLLSPEYVPENRAAQVEDYGANLLRLLSTRPERGTNLVLVGHESVLREVTGESVAEGGAVVFEPLDDEGFRIVGTIGPDEWRRLPGIGQVK
ncbi:MAG: histidine phosphatase family protein [Rubrobacter sp.]